MHDQSALSFKNLWGIKPAFKLKVFYLSLTFLLMSSCLVLWRPLKISVFSKMVGGASFVPEAKIYSLLFIIPLILLYSKLVDWLRRHQLLYSFAIFHASLGLIFSYFLAHPVYGLANTEASPKRLVGWLFYMFMESFDAFFSTTFWSFADSVNNPKDAKNYYGFFVSGSKIGGIVAAGILYLTLKSESIPDHILLPSTLFIGSILLLGAAWAIHLLVKNVSDDYMHGYQAAYTLETHKPVRKRTAWQSIKSSIDGLVIMVKNPYVLGIFSLVFFYEVMIVIFDWWVALHADATHATVGAMTAYYAFYYFLMNVIGLIISFFGTTPMLRFIGIRFALFIFPILCISLLIFTYAIPTPESFFVVLVALRSFNYALNHPTREVLYIPTTKDIKFKAKTWTDAFGSRIAKSFGSMFNASLKGTAPMFALVSSLSLSLGLSFLWLIVVYFLGKTLQDAIDHKYVIGQKDEDAKNLQENQPV